MTTTNERLQKQLAFLTEVDKLKSILRATTLCDEFRAIWEVLQLRIGAWFGAQ